MFLGFVDLLEEVYCRVGRAVDHGERCWRWIQLNSVL